MIQTKPQNPKPQKANNSKQQPTTELTFIEHVYELRKRAFWIVATIIVATALGFQFKDQLISAVMAPLQGEKLVYLTPGGGFSFIFTLSIYFGILLAIPVIVFHVYKFLQPLLKRSSRWMMAVLMSTSILLAASGAAFGYFVTIPAALNFLATFAGDAVTPNLTAESYLNFVVAYILGLAALFQLPLLLFMFDHVRPFPPGSLLSTQRFVIIGATVVAAIITPTPDAFNMAIVAIPIVGIYQLGVIAVMVRHQAVSLKNRRAHMHAQAASASVMERPLTETMQKASEVILESPRPAVVTQAHTDNTIARQPVAVRPIVRQRTTMDGVIRSQTRPITVPTRTVQRNNAYDTVRRRSVDGLSLV